MYNLCEYCFDYLSLNLYTFNILAIGKMITIIILVPSDGLRYFVLGHEIFSRQLKPFYFSWSGSQHFRPFQKK
jgi:hypothetical protein